MSLTQLNPTEREALALLVGRPTRTSRSMQINVEQLDRSLRDAGIAVSLRAALEVIDGPIVNHPAHKAIVRSQWDHLAAQDQWCTPLRIWLKNPVSIGLLKRLSRQNPTAGQQLLERADAVLRRLPTQAIARAQLAAETLGDAHALDSGEPTATIVLATWRNREAALALDGEREDADQSDDRARNIWVRAGVLVNELARPALFLNLPIANGALVEGSPGEPTYASLRKLLRTPPAWAVRNQTVFVCENPNLVAIVADRLGVASAPLVCTDGRPAAAQRVLLNQLVSAGAQLMYHGDFDWPGIQIGNQLMSAWEAQPWRFTSLDYEAAIQKDSPLRHPLNGASVPASWDETLTAAMHHHGIAIAEEAVAPVLLGDLDRG
nr:TIGR02679 family protein [Ralstonia solanacearum]